MKETSLICVLTFLAGCADAGPSIDASATPPELPPSWQPPQDASEAVEVEKLCDGSDDIRIVFSQGGGAVDPVFSFTNPYGYSFAAVDGHCRFYASKTSIEGIVTGTLESSEAAQLAEDVRFSNLGEWSGRYGRSCPDAGAYLIAKADADISCSCGCDGASDAAQASMSGATKWHERLIQSGAPLDGPMRAVATVDVGQPVTPMPQWPLERKIEEIPDLLVGMYEEPKKSALFDAPIDTAALRELRKYIWRDDIRVTDFLPVQHDGKTYGIYARDELPDAAAAALEKLVDAAWKRNSRRPQMD